MRTGYQTNNINVDEIDEILEEIETAGLDNPKIKCCICEREKPAHAVYTLPVVWRHARRMALYMLGQAPRPEPVDEQALVRKYGYTIHDVFCVDCWLDLILDGRKTDS